MTDSNGVPTTPIDPIGFRQAMLIDADTNHHGLLPAAPASDGQTLVSSGGAWVIGVVPAGGDALKILASEPLVLTTNGAGETVLSITPAWLTTNAANALFAALGHAHDWSAITGKPTAYAPTPHAQDMATINGLPATLDAKAAANHTQDWGTITNRPATYPPTAHGHALGEISGLHTALDTKAALAHTQDWATISGKPTAYPAALHEQDWATITNAPHAFPPTAHTQDITAITGLAGALEGKAASQHGHDASEVRSGVLETNRIPPLDAAQVATGLLAPERIPALNADRIASGVLATNRIPALDASHLATGVLAPERVPGLDATQTVSGIFAADRIPGLEASKVTSGVFASNRIPLLDAAHISAGVFAPERIPALSYELPLGNPVADGMVLASGTNGTRRWIAPVTATGTAERFAKFTGAGTLGDSALRERAGMVGVGMEPVSALSVRGDLGTSPGTLYANGPLQVSEFATIGGALSVGGPVQADRSGESAFRGAYAAADGTRGATADVQVRNAAGTGTLTLHFKNGLFTGASKP